MSFIGHPPRRFGLTIALALALLVVAEGASRLVLRDVGNRWEYWDKLAAVKFEDYRSRVSSNSVPDIVVIGDSTGARDLDPASMATQFLAGKDIYNLAWPANFPLAMRATTLPLLREPYHVPKIVIASFTPSSFTDNPRAKEFEQEILGSTYCQHLSGNYSFADKFYLPRLRNSLPFIRESFKPNPEFDDLRKNKGFMPAAVVEDYRSQDSTGRAHEVVSSRFEVLLELAMLSRKRNFQLFILIPPVSAAVESQTASVYKEYLARLELAQKQYDFTILDKRHSDFLTPEYFTDGIHLTPAGASRFSSSITGDFESAFAFASR